MDNRAFYSVLEKVGAKGRYQTLSLVVWSLIIFVAGSSSFFNVFLFYQDEYQCSGQNNCQQYVCTLPQDQRSAFINPDFSSLASKFGDFRCSGSEELDRLQSFVYIGGMVGVISGAFLSQIMTTKALMVATVVANLVGFLLTMCGSTLFMAAIGLFINFAAKSIQVEVVICYITEAVAEEIRGRYSMVIYILFGAGVTLNGLFFKAISSWQLVLIIYDVMPLLIGLAGLLFYIEETPFDLIINYSPEKSLQILHRIAERNGISSQASLTLEYVSNIKSEYQQNEKKNSYIPSILDLFRFDSLRIIFILSVILHFLTSFQFNAPELALSDYSLSVYLNGGLIGLSEVVACIISYFIVNIYKRKTVVYITEGISLAIAVPIFLFCSCSKEEVCSQTKQILQTVGLFLFKFFVTIAYNFFYLIQYETFPNQIRAMGLQTTAIASQLAVVLVPQLVTVAEGVGVSIVFTFAVSCLLVFAFMLKMPETFGVPPPEMIEELKYQHHEVVNDQEIKHL